MNLKFVRRIFAAVSVAVVSSALFASTAEASSVNWDAIAQCESSGNWSIDTGNGYYGGLQISHSTWVAYGGENYAYNANEASKGDQINVAGRILSGQGIGAWPVCGSRGSEGSYKASTPAPVHHTTPKPSKAPTKLPVPVTSCWVKYTVVHGDTLFGIGQKFHVSWPAIWHKNFHEIHDPNLIYPGQRLCI